MKYLFKFSKELKFINIILLVVTTSTVVYAQEKERDTIKTNKIDEVVVISTRLKDKSPFAFSTVKKENLQTINLGQDLPILLDQLTSVVTTSDAGNGVGYTGLRIRGSDATRVNVTLNGIPYNDAESHGTYFVDMPDFASSVEDIQVQRGAGASTNGVGAFGASLNIRTMKPSEKGYATISNSVGSFGTRKHTFSLGSGIKNGFYAEGRISKIASDGYIDRASSDLKSFYGEAGFLGSKTSVKAIVFGGKEVTYQSWYGTPEAVMKGDLEGIKAYIDRNSYMLSQADIDNLLNSGRTYNFYTYKDQVDNYEQNHYQLHFTRQLSNSLNLNISGNYTKGKGYYEEYKPQKKIKDYFPEASNASEVGDAIRRKWLDNDFYAIIYSLNYNSEKLTLNLGGGYNRYLGKHFGEILWNNYTQNYSKDTEYYRSKSNKEDYSVYTKGEYKFFNRLIVFGDLQLRKVDYVTNGISSDVKNININKTYNFFNPKAGITFLINNTNNLYASVSVANKEPNRNDLIKNNIEPSAENLVDYEFGYRFTNNRYSLNINGFYMDYKNQLVLTGAIDSVGDAIRENVGKSYRMGVEVDAAASILNKLKVQAFVTFSQNKIKEFNYVIPDYDDQTIDKIITYTNTDISYSPNLISGGSIDYSPLKGLNLKYLIKTIGKQYLDNTQDQSKIISEYSVSNFNISYSLKTNWIKEINFNLLINNIFNKKYASNGYTYSYFYGNLGVDDVTVTENAYYPQAGTNFITGVTLKF